MEASLRSRQPIGPLFIFLFFFNTFLLPQGITLTLLLTPVWLYLLHRSNRIRLVRYALLPFLLYGLIHSYLGVDLFYYAVSMTMLACICICCLAVWPYLRSRDIDYERLFGRIARINFFFVLISLPLLFLPLLKPLVWYVMSMSEGIRVIPRLKLFTYEASHYSYLLAPLVIYFYGKALFVSASRTLPALVMITAPLALSLSFGVLACLLLSGLIVTAIYFGRIFDTNRKRLLLLLALCLLAFAGYLLYAYFPDNIFSLRFRNMLSGKDTSARGRTYESFILAHKIIAEKSYLWGIGPGQLKVFGRNIIIQYYYYSDIPGTIRIPNACAETIVCFGYIGLALRLGIQLLLFYATKVFRSPYRLWLFLFLFIFQFTGSYITNTTEYVFWLMACSPALDFFARDERVRHP
jgi:hypothetical protein